MAQMPCTYMYVVCIETWHVFRLRRPTAQRQSVSVCPCTVPFRVCPLGFFFESRILTATVILVLEKGVVDEHKYGVIKLAARGSRYSD